MNNGMIGKYVIVRCRDAGVHCGVLEGNEDRQCVLTESRRLFYWLPNKNKKLLSGLALVGADHEKSVVNAVVPRIHLTENCEIILCTPEAEASLRTAPESVRNN